MTAADPPGTDTQNVTLDGEVGEVVAIRDLVPGDVIVRSLSPKVSALARRRWKVVYPARRDPVTGEDIRSTSGCYVVRAEPSPADDYNGEPTPTRWPWSYAIRLSRGPNDARARELRAKMGAP